LAVDLRIAIHWLKWLHKIERTGGALTEALQRIFPPDWNSSKNLEASSSVSDGDSESCSDPEFSDNDEDHDDDL